jgi:hypothetical protein
MYKRWHVEWRLGRKIWFVHSMHSTRLQARIAAAQRKKEFPEFTVRIRDTFMRMHKTLQRAREASRKYDAKRIRKPRSAAKENVP